MLCGVPLRPASEDPMKIVTYNLNGIRARLPRLIEYLAEQKPDALCLQEIKCDDDAFPILDIRAAGYDGVWHGQKGFNGVAILTPAATPPALRRTGLPGDPDDTHSRYIEAEVAGVTVASIYLPNGNPVGTEKFAYKLAWLERLRAHAMELLAEERPTVLAGDWNVIPTDDPDDVFSAKAMAHDALMQPESRQAFRRILNLGFTDAIRARYPEGAVYTFWDYTAGCWQRDAGFRIDHLLLSAAGRRPPPRRRRRQGVSRPRESQRPRADMGRDRRLSLRPDSPPRVPAKAGTQPRLRTGPRPSPGNDGVPVSRRRPGPSAAFALDGQGRLRLHHGEPPQRHALSRRDERPSEAGVRAPERPHSRLHAQIWLQAARLV